MSGLCSLLPVKEDAVAEACQEELLFFMATNGICSSAFKDDDKGNQTVRNKDRWGARWSQRGIPCFQLTAVIYISFTPTDLEQGARQQCFTETLQGEEVQQTLDLSTLQLLDPFMPSLDITMKYRRIYSLFL